MVICKQKNENFYVTTNSELLVINTKTGNDKIVEIPDPIVPSNLTKGQQEVLLSECHTITSIDTSKNGDYIVVSTENKQIVVYDKNLKPVKNFIINRAASKVKFTHQNDVLIADKSGDAYLYKLNYESNESKLILGHLSMLLDVLISDCGRYIITCDRDEKIRVSHYPNAYNIVSYCLGHKEFVTNVYLCNNVLISASGDGTVRFWNYLEGIQLNIINTNDCVKDKSIIEQFCKEMDNDKVEVHVLPIADMQIWQNDIVYVAVALLNYNEILLYTADLKKTVSINYIRSIVLNSSLLCFSLSNNVFVLTEDGFTMHDLFTDKSICNCFENVHKKYKEFFDSSNNNNKIVSALYKRKFDNVHEYLERKKARLELK